MLVTNVHARRVRADASTVGALIDSLASPGDLLWPHRKWPAMRFDRPGLTVGGTGGHGPVGYRVAHHVPGSSATFEFTGRPPGLRGRHQYFVQPTGADACTLWHLTEAELRGRMRLTWWLIWRPLHNALIEDSLAQAERHAQGWNARPTRWSPWVRLLRAAVRRVMGQGARRLMTPTPALRGSVGLDPSPAVTSTARRDHD